MDALCVTARNIRHHVIDGEICPEIEAILTVVGKIQKPDGSIPEYRTVRLSLNPGAARQLAGSLREWADDAEKEAEALTWSGTPE